MKPVAWIYELAASRLGAPEGYDGWQERISVTKPNVPEGAIRNLRALYPGPLPETKEQILS